MIGIHGFEKITDPGSVEDGKHKFEMASSVRDVFGEDSRGEWSGNLSPESPGSLQLRTAHQRHLLLSVPELLHQAGTDKETERIGATLQKVPRLSDIRKERDVPRLLPPHVLSHRNQLQGPVIGSQG